MINSRHFSEEGEWLIALLGCGATCLTFDSSDEAVETFKELFLQACPKYLSVNPPPYEDQQLLEEYIANPPQDASHRQLDLFLSDVAAIKGVVGARNLLKVYTSIDATKLAAFMDEEGHGDKEEGVLQQLMVLKAATRTYAKGPGEGTLLDGERIVTNNLDFTIDGVGRILNRSVALYADNP